MQRQQLRHQRVELLAALLHDLEDALRRLGHDQHGSIVGVRDLRDQPLLEQAREDVVGVGAADAGLARDVAHRRLTELERGQIEAHFGLVQTDVHQDLIDRHRTLTPASNSRKARAISMARPDQHCRMRLTLMSTGVTEFVHMARKIGNNACCLECQFG